MFFRVLERAAGTEGHAFNRISNPNPVVGTVFQKVFDLSWLIGEAQNDLFDAGSLHQIDLIEKKRAIGDRNHRLWRINRQRPKPRPLATGENESFHWRS